jgi:dTMP kinase
MTERGRFLVFEGLDGAGSTTQMELIGDWLRQLAIPVFTTFEPTGSAVGQHIRALLKDDPWADDVGWAEYMALLFGADRTAHLSHPDRGIEAALDRGEWVLCDRYLVSSLAYQSSEDVPESWVLAVNRAAARFVPDVTVFVDTPVELCLERIAERNRSTPEAGKDDVFHDAGRLTRISARYAELLAAGEVAGSLISVDGSPPVDQVCGSIKDALMAWSGRASAGLPPGPVN